MVVIIWADWYALTFIIISVVLAIISLAYMIGIGFHLPKLQAWAKEELYQVFASALIAVLLISFVSTIETTMKAAYNNQVPFDIANGYIDTMISNLGVYFMSVVATDVEFALLQSMLYSAMPSQIGFKIDPFAGMTTLTSLLSLMMEAILTGMAIMIGQKTFLLFIHNRLTMLFPIGIALRAFPFTRAAGGALIAIFLGFYIFYPFMWVFDSAVYNEISSAGYIHPNFSDNGAGLGAACTSDTVSCTTNTQDIGGNIIFSLLFGSMVQGVSTGTNALGYTAVYYLFIFVVIMSIFNLLTTLVLTNELAKILGSEIDLGGLSGII